MPVKPSCSSRRARSSVARRRPATATRLTAGFVVMRGSLYAPMRASVRLVGVLLLAGCNLGQSVRLPVRPEREAPSIAMRVLRPDGAGPFPAVVWLHGCGGVTPGARHLEDWTRRLTRMGYVVAIPDRFPDRGYPRGVC